MKNKSLHVYLIKLAAVTISAYSALLAVRTFILKNEVSASVFISLITFCAFIPLLQFGLSRPLYAQLRKSVAENNVDKKFLGQAVALMAIMHLLSATAFSISSYYFSIYQKFPGNSIDLAIFFFGYAAIFSSIFWRDIFYALDRELPFEIGDVIRKFLLVLIMLAISNGLDLVYCGLLLALISLTSNSFLIFFILRHFGAHLIIPRYISFHFLARNSLFYFLFSLLETSFYYIPIIYFSFIRDSNGMIFMAIWFRLFFLLPMASRLLIDTGINSIIRRLHISGAHSVKISINNLFYLSGFTSLFVFSIFILLSNQIMGWLNTPANLRNDFWLFSSLGMWCIGNWVQHLYGSLVNSLNTGFKRAFFYSSISFILVSTTFFISIKITTNYGVVMLVTGVSYFFGSMPYLKYGRRILNDRSNDNV